MFDNDNKTGIYIRLSREDEDKKQESESIVNQRSLLLQYVRENNYNLVDIYVDDGYSGTNFERPGFKRLIRDIEEKKINVVLTKDMSRLGRDYIETGNLLEKYFPEHNVRYIAVTDNIDTFLDSSNNEIAPFKAIMNDMYAKDISKKIKASLKAKRKEGKFVGCRPSFGYRVDPEDKNHLVVDEEQALVVERIFKMALEGLSFYKIALKLTEEGVRTPASYYDFKWRSNYNVNYARWHPKTVSDILTNRVYVGDLVQGKRVKVNYKIKKVVKAEPNDYVVVRGTHRAIVDSDIFEEVQKRLPKNVGRVNKKENYLLEGLLYCKECGHRISVTSRRKKDNRRYTVCNYYRTYIRDKVCTTHSNNYDILEELVVRKVKEVLLDGIDTERIKGKIWDRIRVNNLENKEELEILLKKLDQVKNNLDKIYIDKLNGVISLEQYNRVKEKLEGTLEVLEGNYKRGLTSENARSWEEEKRKIACFIDDYLTFEKLDRELIVSLIERIEITADGVVDVKLVI